MKWWQRHAHSMLYPLLWLVLLSALTTLGDVPSSQYNTSISPTVLWSALILGIMLHTQSSWQDNAQQGMVAQWLLMPQPLVRLIVLWSAPRWVMSMIPYTMCAWLMAHEAGLSSSETWRFLLVLWEGSLALWLLCLFQATLVLGLHNASLLLPLLVLPLVLPLLVATTSFTQALMAHQEAQVFWFWLATSLSLLYLLVTPWAIASTLKVSQWS